MRRKTEERTISGRTLEEIVREYLAELDNPAPDYTMRQIYRDWMREFVGAPGAPKS